MGNAFEADNVHSFSQIQLVKNADEALPSGRVSYWILDGFEPAAFNGQPGSFSQKRTQLTEVQESTALSYLDELDRKYGGDRRVADTPRNRQFCPTRTT